MNIKQKIILILGLVLGTSLWLSAPVAQAAGNNNCGVDTSIITCPKDTNNDKNADVTKNATWALLIMGLNILTAGIGIAAVGAIVFASILYTSAADNAAQLQKAKDIIKNTVIGLIAYGFMYLIINYITPGGLFN